MRYSIFILVSLFLCLQNVYGHRIDVFCYTEDNVIKCYSKFSTGTPVRYGKYQVYIRKKLIYEGKSDDQGNFVYKIPKELLNNPKDLKIVCIAEMGHENYWIVKKEEYATNIQKEPSSDNDFFDEEEDLSKENKTTQTTHQASIDIIRLEKSIRKIIASELSPIKLELVKLQEPKIDLRDILGGIGYIFGIMGIIMYFKSQKS